MIEDVITFAINLYYISDRVRNIEICRYLLSIIVNDRILAGRHPPVSRVILRSRNYDKLFLS